jgi:hypothetical protein
MAAGVPQSIMQWFTWCSGKDRAQVLYMVAAVGMPASAGLRDVTIFATTAGCVCYSQQTSSAHDSRRC